MSLVGNLKVQGYFTNNNIYRVDPKTPMIRNTIVPIFDSIADLRGADKINIVYKGKECYIPLRSDLTDRQALKVRKNGVTKVVDTQGFKIPATDVDSILFRYLVSGTGSISGNSMNSGSNGYVTGNMEISLKGSTGLSSLDRRRVPPVMFDSVEVNFTVYISFSYDGSYSAQLGIQYDFGYTTGLTRTITCDLAKGMFPGQENNPALEYYLSDDRYWSDEMYFDVSQTGGARTSIAINWVKINGVNMPFRFEPK